MPRRAVSPIIVNSSLGRIQVECGHFSLFRTALDGIRRDRQPIRMSRGRARHFSVVAAALLSLSQTTQARPADYAPAPPPLDFESLRLPSVAPEPDLAEDSTTNSARALRDAAIRAFQHQRYTESLEKLDQLATMATLPATMQRLQAWAATYAHSDQRAAALWSQCSVADRADSEARLRAAWHALRDGHTLQANDFALQALALTPQAPYTLLLAGITSWAESKHAAAQRLLVQAMRSASDPTDCIIAMAALQASLGNFPESSGWMRQVFPRLSREKRIHWLSQPEFENAQAKWQEGWVALLAEAGLSQDDLLSDTRATSDITPAPISSTNATATSESLLTLSPFSTQPRIRLEQVRLYQQQSILARLQAEDHLSDDLTVGEFEILGSQK